MKRHCKDTAAAEEPDAAPHHRRRVIRLPEVLRLYPVGRTTWYDGVRAGAYPRQVKLGRRAVGWWEHEVLALAEQRRNSGEDI